jgi:4'-phosphopantetheinyl transferase
LRYITAHGALREILSRYVGAAPERLRFDQSENGKPSLIAGSGEASPIQFSLSHSHDQALVAVTNGHSVGVDIERVDSDPGVLAVAGRVFSADEQEALCACTVSDRLSLFFQMWVCKEAYIKARGGTILDRLASFTVSVSSPDQARLVSDGRDPSAASRWRIHLIQCETGFAAAVASTRSQGKVILHRWPQAH